MKIRRIVKENYLSVICLILLVLILASGLIANTVAFV